MLVVGYTDLNGTQGGHWIVKNSWGTSWGVGGFGYISKYHDCSLKYDVYQFVDSTMMSPKIVVQWGLRLQILSLALILFAI